MDSHVGMVHAGAGIDRDGRLADRDGHRNLVRASEPGLPGHHVAPIDRSTADSVKGTGPWPWHCEAVGGRWGVRRRSE